jgi:D-3-phosphoglycerate dehydrogenase
MRILITEPIDPEGVKLLKSQGLDVDEKYAISYEELRSVIVNYDAIIVRSGTKITREIIDAARLLKVIGRAGVGLDNIDVDYAISRGIKVVSTPEATSTSVAELVFAYILCHYRKLIKADFSMKNKKWLKHELTGNELKGKVLGIIGLGRIGMEVARRAKAFEMRLLVYDIRDVSKECSEVGALQVPLRTLLEESDIISIHVPLTRETYHMISEKELSIMKRTAIIINTSRGEVIDGKALLKALNEGQIAGAGLDVFKNEPPTEEWEIELISHPNVIATPHIGATTKEAQRRAGYLIANAVLNELIKSK